MVWHSGIPDVGEMAWETSVRKNYWWSGRTNTWVFEYTSLPEGTLWNETHTHWFLELRINSVSFGSPFPPYDCDFVAKSFRVQTATLAGAVWCLHCLCTQISFSNQKQIGGKNRFGRDDMYPDFLMEVSSKKRHQALMLCWTPILHVPTYSLP